MGFLTDLKKASLLPAVRVDRSLAASPLQTAAITGINRFGLFGFGSVEMAPYENTRLMKDGYLDNHIVFTIAHWKAKQLAKGTPIVYQVKSKKDFRKYKHLTFAQKQQEYSLRYKALDEIDDPSHRLVRLFRQPNPQQTWAEFAYAISVYHDFGNALIWGNRVTGGLNKGQIGEMYLLPTAVYSGRGPLASGYQEYFDSTGINAPIPGSEVLHIRQFNPDPTMQGGQLWGMSKLTPARRLLAKSQQAVEAQAEMFMNRGARTIIFPKGNQYNEETAASVQDATETLRIKLKKAGSGGISGSPVELDKIELGMSAVDLNLIESEKSSETSMCALWNVDPVAVFAAASEASRANAETAVKKSLYTGVFPDQSLYFQKLNGWVVPAYGDNLYVEPNTDIYPEMQVDKVEMMSWAEKCILSGNQRNELFGFERSEEPGMDIPLVPAGLTPITFFNQPTAGNTDNEEENDGTYN